MKWLLFLSLFTSFSAFAISHKEFVKLPRAQREKVIAEYKNFLKEYSKTVEISSARPMSFPQFIEAAYAAEADCLYGGWPSQRVNGLCSLPRTSPAFQRESCEQGQMPCQPLLFGRGVCVPNATREQKRSAFANCEKKFEDMGRKLSDVVEYTSDPEVGQEADELFRLVDSICTSGAQASTPMCKNLKDRVNEIKSAKTQQPSPKPQAERPAPQRPAPQTAIVPPEKPQTALTVAAEDAGKVNGVVAGLNTVTRCEACEAQRQNTVDEPGQPQTTPPQTPPQASTGAFPRVLSGLDDSWCGGARSVPDGSYSITYVMKCNGPSDKLPDGYHFDQTKGSPYLNVQSRYDNPGPVLRTLDVVTRNDSSNETHLYIVEDGGGPDSHNYKSSIYLIPRKTLPSVRAEGNNLILTLATGETVTMDKNSRAITGGAMTEGPIDLNTDRFQRKPSSMKYSGAGISIRVDHRYEVAEQFAENAIITQGNKTCKIPRAKIFNEKGLLITTTDAGLLAVVNQNCSGGGFSLP